MADSTIGGLTSGNPGTTAVMEYEEGGASLKVDVPTLLAHAVAPTTAANAQGISGASDTYVTGSALDIAGKLKAGSVLHWQFVVTKTAAGTVAPQWNVRFGTAGSTADTSRLALTSSAQTAAVDSGVFEIFVAVASVGASGVVRGFVSLNHNLASTGLGVGTGFAQGSSAAFDTTVASLKAGVSVNPGTSAAWTVQFLLARAYNLA